MSKKKRTLLITTAVTMALILAIGATLAYLTDSRNAKNIIGIGRDSSGEDGAAIGIYLDEPDFVEQIKEMRAEYTDETDKNKVGKYKVIMKDGVQVGTEEAELYSLLPSEPIRKDPTVKNYGLRSIYLRFIIDYDQTGAANEDITWQQLKDELKLDLSEANDGRFHVVNDTAANRLIFYYVEAGTEGGTDPKALPVTMGKEIQLFKKGHIVSDLDATMVIPKDFGSSDYTGALKEGHLSLDITAEAVQTAGLDDIAIPWADADGEIAIEDGLRTGETYEQEPVTP